MIQDFESQPDDAVELEAAPANVESVEQASSELAAPAEESTAVASEPAAQPAAPAVDPQAPIGPRWYAVHTSSQPAPVNLLLRDAVADEAANEAAVIARFKFGHGITHTPHELRVRSLGHDYVPTGADVDHHEAIEAAIASAASAK